MDKDTALKCLDVALEYGFDVQATFQHGVLECDLYFKSNMQRNIVADHVLEKGIQIVKDPDYMRIR